MTPSGKMEKLPDEVYEKHCSMVEQAVDELAFQHRRQHFGKVVCIRNVRLLQVCDSHNVRAAEVIRDRPCDLYGELLMLSVVQKIFGVIEARKLGIENWRVLLNVIPVPVVFCNANLHAGAADVARRAVPANVRARHDSGNSRKDYSYSLHQSTSGLPLLNP